MDLTIRRAGAADAESVSDLYVRSRRAGAETGSSPPPVSNERAQRFYERNGFREVERTDGSGNEEHAPAIQYVWK